jgi:hypothetical protein
LRKLEFVKADKQTSRYKPLHAPIIPETPKDPRLINAPHRKPIAPQRPPLLLGCAIHNPSLYYLATLAMREKRSEPTQENITLCYESRVTFPALQGFHVVIRAPGVLPLAGRYRARAVLRANDRAPTGTRAFPLFPVIWIWLFRARREYSACHLSKRQRLQIRKRREKFQRIGANYKCKFARQMPAQSVLASQIPTQTRFCWFSHVLEKSGRSHTVGLQTWSVKNLHRPLNTGRSHTVGLQTHPGARLLLTEMPLKRFPAFLEKRFSHFLPF